MKPQGMIALALCFFALLVFPVQSSNILFYFGVSTYSHRITVWPLVEALSAQGHKITFLSPFPPKKPNPNVTEFSTPSLQNYIGSVMGGETDLIKQRLDGNHEALWDMIREMGTGSCEILMKDQSYIDLVVKNHFDLVVVDALYNDCALGIVHYQKTRHIIYDTTHPFMWQYEAYGFPAETSWISDLAYSYKYPLTYFNRFVNTIRPLIWYYSKVWIMFPRLEKAITDGFKLNDSICIRCLESQVELVLLNSHFSLENARSLPPLFVPVGGLHISDKIQPMPKDIQKFVDESGDEGFIYISFGSAAQISKANPAILKIFFDAFGKSKTRFVWKWESDTVPSGMPSNVITAKWMPQNDILAHPKIRAFITHGGLLSIQEATSHSVPLILFPFFAEQDFNAERANRIGYGIRLDFRTLNPESLETAINDILYDSKYKNKMAEVSTAFKDRPTKPLETAIWWTEYVLRSNTSLLKPLGIEQSWFVRRSLDIWGVIIGTVALLSGLICGYKLRTLVGPSMQQQEKKLKKN